MKTLTITILLLSSVAYAQPRAPLSLTNPPTGIDTAVWEDIWNRSQKVGKMAAKTIRGANAACIAATALDILAWAEADVSLVARRDPSQGLTPSVDTNKGPSVKRQVRRHREDTCRGPGGGGPTGSATATDLEALLRFTSDTAEWQTSDYESWKQTANAIRAAFAAGIGAGSQALTAASLLPIINPCAIAPRLSICAKTGVQDI